MNSIEKFFILQCVFMTAGMAFLKLAGALTLSWWAVTSPLWLPSLGGLVTIFIMGIIFGILWIARKLK